MKTIKKVIQPLKTIKKVMKTITNETIKKVM